MAPPTPAIQRFATLLKTEWTRLDAKRAGLDTEDLLDIFWLARHISPSAPASSPTQTADSTVETRQGESIAPPPQGSEPKVSVSLPPPPTDAPAAPDPGLGAGLPLQVPAANALRSQLDLARAMRPLRRKIPSPTQWFLDEEATVVQIAEQGVWSPVRVRAPERQFDLAIVVETGPSLKLWADTIAEFQALVEQQGAFRQIRTWGLRGHKGEAIELSANWQPTAAALPPRSPGILLDPTGRRIVWLVSDCTADLWDYPPIYHALAQWGQRSPLAILQLFPERLWPRTALGIGQPLRFRAATPGAAQAVLRAGATLVYPVLPEPQPAEPTPSIGLPSIALPVISLEPEPLHRWASVTAGVGDASVVGLQIFLNQLAPQPDLPVPPSVLTPEQRVQQFCATASIAAQRLAGLMAALPVSVPVAHLIQKTLLPQSRQVHLAEVFMGGLLESAVHPDRPTHYYFLEPVRLKLVDAVPISRTMRVMDTVSAYISERLGLGTQSFEALIAALPHLEPGQQQEMQPFAEIGLGTLRRLGGDYRAKADRLAAYLTPPPPELLSSSFPVLQVHDYQTAWVEVELLQRFEFETATLESQRRGLRRQTKWLITKSPGFGWQRVEDLGNGIALELVEIVGGRFQMGSPEDEPERYDDEGPRHEVTLRDFFMAKYPVTQAQWQAVAALPMVNQELGPDPSHFKGNTRPVECVSWEDAVEFCARLSMLTGREYGLPTEAEWEYACRAGTTTPFHFGETITTDLANYRGTDNKEYNWSGSYDRGPKGEYREQTIEVGTFPANAFGLSDMHGNVWEWCADHWHDSYTDKPAALKADGNLAWLLAEGSIAEGSIAEGKAPRRSLRGGSWLNYPRYCRSAIRHRYSPDARDDLLGFRVVCRLARTL
jgi:formylglycine-generating enzyme required for sulfatase activity